MHIAFYAPLKSPDHPVPSGDRLMSRLIIRALEMAGHKITLASGMRAFLPGPEDATGHAALTAAATRERARIAHDWRGNGAPDLWFCYHPYYKSPDLLGPALAAAFNLPLVTAEASYSPRRNIGVWQEMQAQVLQMVSTAAVNICMTARDMTGLQQAAPLGQFARLPPFIDPAPYAAHPAPAAGHLITVAMMRPGDKQQSYANLAASLALLPDLPWTLSIIGDGPVRGAVEALFAGVAPGRLRWHGQLAPNAIAALLANAAIYLWPGCGEAYGLAYLEAQAAGLPVIAFRTAGVPEVVAHGISGLLTPDGEPKAYAQAITALLQDPAQRATLASGARAKTLRDHALETASVTLDHLVQTALARRA